MKFAVWGKQSDPEQEPLVPPDQVKLTMLEAEKHRDTHHKQSKILEWTLQTLVVLQIVNGALISALSAADLGSNIPTVALGALASILGGVIATFKNSKSQQREQLAYFALDTFIRKWRDWAYDLERNSSLRWVGRHEDLNEDNFNSAYDQIQRYELDAERNLVDFAYAVTANTPSTVIAPRLPIGIGGVAQSPLSSPRGTPSGLSPVR
ncbi:hypothetical protein BDV93DRAFT_560017 [Ceratobasidium sp. AG-I]|nr:hypothetical protein BDV93DRAFT_560017 [Ceratobasidium sp. AG-I]